MKRAFNYSRACYEEAYHGAEMKLAQADPATYYDTAKKKHYHDREKEVWAKLPKPVSGTVLEVACSAGKSAFWMLEQFPAIKQMYMFDFSQPAVDFCKRNPKFRDKTVIWQGDVQKIACSDGMFDWVNCVDVTEHLPPAIYAKAIKEMLRVCKPGGHLILMAGSDKQCTEHIHLISDKVLVPDFVKAGWVRELALPYRHFLLRKP